METVEDRETQLSLDRACDRVSLYLSSHQLLQWVYALQANVFTTRLLATLLCICLVYNCYLGPCLVI